MCLNKLSKCSKYNTLIIRILIAFTFVFFHGYGKISGGVEKWTNVGGVMAVFGFTFLPAFWGFIAAFAEFVGAFLIGLGLFTRYAAAFLGLTMLVGLIGVHGSDVLALNLKGFELALVYLVLSITLMFSGAGEVGNLEKKLFKKEL